MDYLTYTNGGYCEFLGPSSATKPTTDLHCGIWVESDTGDVYFYDNVNGWTYQFSFNDGGNGGAKSMIKPSTDLKKNGVADTEEEQGEPEER